MNDARPSSSTNNGLGLTLLAGILWGTGGLAGTLLTDAAGTSSVTNAAIRLLGGGLLVTVFLVVTGGWRRMRKDRLGWRRLGLIGVAAAVFQAAYFSAVALSSLSFATLVTIGLSPVLVVVATALRDRRRPENLTLITTAVAVLGLVLLVGFPDQGLDGRTLAAIGLCVVSASGFGFITMVNAVPVPGLSAVAAAGPAFVIGGVVLLPVAVLLSAVDGGSLFAELGRIDDLKAVGLVLFLALVPTALAYLCFFRGLESTPPAGAALSALLEPLTATVLATLILDERMSALSVVGAVLIGGAVLAKGLLGRPIVVPV